MSRQHNNTHPITKEPLTPVDLIALHYSRREASGEIHDPISFKSFNEHSHIVAIATTGNVFLAESIKGGQDLVNGIAFKKYVWLFHPSKLPNGEPSRQDVVTLQNPHALPPSYAPGGVTSSKTDSQSSQSLSSKTAVSKLAPATLNGKDAIPCMVTVYITSPSAHPYSREYISIFKWDAWRIVNLYVGGSSDRKFQASLGRSTHIFAYFHA